MDNFLATFLNGGPASPPMLRPEQANQSSMPRRSALDIIGGLGDVFARVGGADAQYQPQVDARTERARQVDLDAMRKQQFEMQQRTGEQGLKRGEQQFAAGELEIDEAQRGVLGQATRGLAAVYSKGGAPALQKAWPMLAQQLQIPPEQADIFGQALTSDPEGTLTALNSALNPPAAQGSQAKELQIVEFLDKRDPTGKLSEQYVANVASGMDANEAARIAATRYGVDSRTGVARDKLEWDKNPNNPRNQPKPTAAGKGAVDKAAAATSAQGVITEMRDAFNRLKDAGGINASGQSGTQRAGAWAMENIPLAERMTNPEAFSARQDLDRLRTQGITSLLPVLGGLQLGGKNIDAAKELDTWRKAIASASDYESAMRALNGFQTRINQILAEEPAASPRPRRSGTLSPRPRRNAAPAAGGWKVIGVN